MITVHQTIDPLNTENVQGLPRQFCHLTWSGESMARAFSWALAVDDQNLWFVGELPAAPCEHAFHMAGEFVEGLWESDVLELFIRNPQGRYQEFNVSVDGAWWSMTFSDHRQRAQSVIQPAGIGISVHRGEESWGAVMKIPHVSLEVPFNNDSAVHVSGIMYGSDHVTYLSSCGALSFAPDFHDPRCFQSVAPRILNS